MQPVLGDTREATPQNMRAFKQNDNDSVAMILTLNDFFSQFILKVVIFTDRIIFPSA